jgi:hypothetical protein
MKLRTELPQRVLQPLLADLERWDRSFSTAWGTRPTSDYVRAFDGLREQVLRASHSLRTSPFTELRPVGTTLERRARDMASVVAQLASMQARGTTFGSGWDRVLDQPIADVRYGLQLLGAHPHPAPYPGPDPTPYPNPAPYPGPDPAPYPAPDPWTPAPGYPGDA